MFHPPRFSCFLVIPILSDNLLRLKLILEVIDIFSARSLSAIISNKFCNLSDIVALIIYQFDDLLHTSFRVSSVLLKVERPDPLQVAALPRKVEAGICNLGWRVFANNVIMFDHHVTEELCILSHFDQSPLCNILI